MRLRQVALAARDLDRAKAHLESLGLRDPFRDPGVKEFGLDNAVYPVGDTFLEVVAPIQDGTTAGRYLDRRGEDLVGYMVIVQVDDLETTRARAADLGMRSVWSIDLDDIAATHLHPKDLGAITSVDRPVDPASWRWAGPGWEDRAVAGGLRSVTVGGADPQRWIDLLDRPLEDGAIHLDDGSEIRFADGDAITVELDIAGTVVSLP